MKSEHVLRILLVVDAGDPPVISSPRLAVGRLTPAEARVLSLLREGMAAKEVSRALAISVHTVHAYVKRIYLKADVNTRGGLLAIWSSSAACHGSRELFPEPEKPSVAEELTWAVNHLSRALQAAKHPNDRTELARLLTMTEAALKEATARGASN